MKRGRNCMYVTARIISPLKTTFCMKEPPIVISSYWLSGVLSIFRVFHFLYFIFKTSLTKENIHRKLLQAQSAKSKSPTASPHIQMEKWLKSSCFTTGLLKVSVVHTVDCCIWPLCKYTEFHKWLKLALLPFVVHTVAGGIVLRKLWVLALTPF